MRASARATMPPRPTAGRTACRLRGRHDGPSARLRAAAGAARPAQSAGAVVAVATYPAAAAPGRVSADAAVVRHQAEGRHAGPYAVVADLAAADAGDARHPRRRRSVVESTGREHNRRHAYLSPDR